MYILSRDKSSFDGLNNVSFLRVTFEMLPSGSWNDLLSSYGELESQVHFNFMIDLEYFIRNGPKNDKSRVMFITGDNLGNLPSGYFQR